MEETKQIYEPQEPQDNTPEPQDRPEYFYMGWRPLTPQQEIKLLKDRIRKVVEIVTARDDYWGRESERQEDDLS